MKLARLLLITLVALVVPLQGMAAVAAGQCMALGHHQGDTGHGEGHPHEAADSHDHSAHSHSGEAAAHGDEDDQSATHCGPCAACCASATIAAANHIPIAAFASTPPYVFWQFPPFGDRPDALDRPPLPL